MYTLLADIKRLNTEYKKASVLARTLKSSAGAAAAAAAAAGVSQQDITTSSAVLKAFKDWESEAIKTISTLQVRCTIQ
jgi:hypothetical protein